jgi:hypothetical protein
MTCCYDAVARASIRPSRISGVSATDCDTAVIRSPQRGLARPLTLRRRTAPKAYRYRHAPVTASLSGCPYDHICGPPRLAHGRSVSAQGDRSSPLVSKFGRRSATVPPRPMERDGQAAVHAEHGTESGQRGDCQRHGGGPRWLLRHARDRQFSASQRQPRFGELRRGRRRPRLLAGDGVPRRARLSSRRRRIRPLGRGRCRAWSGHGSPARVSSSVAADRAARERDAGDGERRSG